MAAGSKLGRYELLARIATGGMGEIFLARLEGAAGFEKLCVIKRILPHLADDGRFRAMLVAEAQIASNMSHANVCHVYELDEVNRQLYMVMEYLEGVTLLQVLRAVSQRNGKLEFGFIAGVVQQACEGLHYAHELRDRNGGPLGVVHRDVTPSNLFLTESGVVKIVDFGIAKARDSSNTDAGSVKGKYAYMAPEQLRGGPIDRRVDVFSLGVVVFEMLTCRRLFQRKTDYLTFRAVMEPPLVDLRQYRPEAPEALTTVLRQALERDPIARHPTMRQFVGALVEAFGGVRPWAQSEISELVRTMFADELSLANAEISKVIKRSERDSSRAIPVIMRRAPSPTDVEYVDADGPGREGPPSAPPGVFSASSEVRSEGLGAPGAEPPESQPPPDEIHPAEASALPVAPRRYPVLPMVSVLAGAAAVLALGLVLIAARRPGGSPVRPRPVALAPGEADRAQAERHRRRPVEPYSAAIHGHERELDQCARDHADTWPPDARAVIVVGVDGRARDVAIKPETAAHSRLGDCIRDVLQIVSFPAAAEDKEVALGLALYR